MIYEQHIAFIAANPYTQPKDNIQSSNRTETERYVEDDFIHVFFTVNSCILIFYKPPQ